jgi:superfamily II DNA/RNA helicase
VSVPFHSLGLPEDIVRALAARGIQDAFPIQAATIPDLMAGRDVCGQAPTGSGKTLAFGLPILARVRRARPGRPRALVLAPTRELASQIVRELEGAAAVRRRSIAAVYGGVGYGPQRHALQRGVDVLVACPGRLEDLLAQGALRLDEIDHVVLDEADRMADMGFLPSVRRLVSLTPATRQVILFSATLDGDVGKLVREFQRDVVRHDVAPKPVEQDRARHAFFAVENDARAGLACEVVATAGPTIVFCRTRHRADRVARDLAKHGVKAAAIHGGRSQSQRDRALADFARGSVHALVATDVAARGIHVDDVACVLHYDPPVDSTTYVHRSGRTARAGAQGIVLSFVGREDVVAARRLQRTLALAHAEPGDLRGLHELAPERITAETAPERQPRHREQPRPATRRRSRDGRPYGRPAQPHGLDQRHADHRRADASRSNGPRTNDHRANERRAGDIRASERPADDRRVDLRRTEDAAQPPHQRARSRRRRYAPAASARSQRASTSA